MVARASHIHELFQEDTKEWYYKLEEGTRGTAYADSIKPFQRTKDGRGAWTAIKAQYAGQDKWEQEIKRMDSLLHTRKWCGQSNYALEQHCQAHRNAYVFMGASAEQITGIQLPSVHTRVEYLIDSIENNDAGLQVSLDAI